MKTQKIKIGGVFLPFGGVEGGRKGGGGKVKPPYFSICLNHNESNHAYKSIFTSKSHEFTRESLLKL